SEPGRMLTPVKRRRWGGWQASSLRFRTTAMGTLVVVSAPAGCGLTDSNADAGDAGDPDAGPDSDAGAEAGHDASDVGGAGGTTIDPECPLDPASDPFGEQAIAFPTG